MSYNNIYIVYIMTVHTVRFDWVIKSYRKYWIHDDDCKTLDDEISNENLSSYDITLVTHHKHDDEVLIAYIENNLLCIVHAILIDYKIKKEHKLRFENYENHKYDPSTSLYQDEIIHPKYYSVIRVYFEGYEQCDECYLDDETKEFISWFGNKEKKIWRQQRVDCACYDTVWSYISERINKDIQYPVVIDDEIYNLTDIFSHADVDFLKKELFDDV